MREFLDVELLSENDYFIDEFCFKSGCEAMKYKEITREEPGGWECTACGYDFYGHRCLRDDAVKKIFKAIDECNRAINKAMELK